MAVAGESELQLHAVMAAITLGAILAFVALAKRVAPRAPLFAAALLFLGPGFLPGQNLMMDVPALALWIAFFWAVDHAGDGGRGAAAAYAAAGAAAGAACLVKYTSLVLLPLLVLVIVWRREWRALWAVLIPVAALAAWTGLNLADFGAPHLLGRPTSGAGEARFLVGSVEWLAGLGAVAPFTVLWLGRPLLGRSGLIALATSAASAVACWALLPAPPPPGFADSRLLFTAMTANGVFCAVMALARAGGDLERGFARDSGPAERRRAERVGLLVLWWGAALAFVVLFAPALAVRHVMLALPALVLLACADPTLSLRPARRAVALACTAALGAGLAAADYLQASVYRDAAPRIAQLYRGDGTLWYLGHWGWQWYAEKAGMKPYDHQRAVLAKGDHVVIPAGVALQLLGREDHARMHRIGEIEVPAPPWAWLRPSGSWPLGGYYLYYVRDGKVCPPWRLSRAPLERFVVFSVAEAAPAGENRGD
jgi:hypothetical protein